MVKDYNITHNFEEYLYISTINPIKKNHKLSTNVALRNKVLNNLEVYVETSYFLWLYYCRLTYIDKESDTILLRALKYVTHPELGST